MKVKIKKIFTKQRVIKIIKVLIVGAIIFIVLAIPKVIKADINDNAVEEYLRNTVLEYANYHQGIPYKWGGDVEDMMELGGLDCSGFVQKVYLELFGVDIGRTTWDQINYGKVISYNELKIGDLVFTNNCKHVGIYVGDGNMINAVDEGDCIRVTKIINFFRAKRIIYKN